MQHDEVIWELIGHHFCSYKIKTPDDKQHFCKNEYNLTGLCNRLSCPLANSQYATIREYKGVCYLLMKTIERAHTPSQLWEKVKLSNAREKANKQIESQLEFWPEFIKVKCKLRYKRMMQVLSKKRSLMINSLNEAELKPFKQKSERREKIREVKAEIAARLDQSIEKELLERLKDGVYGDIYNFPKKNFEKVIIKDKDGKPMIEKEVSEEEEFFEAEEDETDEEAESESDQVEEEFEFEESDEEEEAIEDSVPLTKTKRKGPVVEIEYEEETGRKMGKRTIMSRH